MEVIVNTHMVSVFVQVGIVSFEYFAQNVKCHTPKVVELLTC